MLPQGTLAEIIEESIYTSPAPTAKHQRIVGKLYRLLADHVEKITKGEVFISPFDVYLDETSNAVQPDVIFVGVENSRIVKEDSIHGVPDFLSRCYRQAIPDMTVSLRRNCIRNSV